jgi:hypothetical protein
MGEQEHVTIGEFSRTMQSLERQIRSGFDGVNARLDGLVQTQVDHEGRISRLDERTSSASRRAGVHGATWGSIVTMIGALIQYLLGLKHTGG